MRLLVCGSRMWPDYRRVEAELVALAPSLVMHGGAKGADELAGLTCETRGVPLLVFRADWHHDGKSAGPIRNARMLRDGKPDRGLAFGALWRWIEPTNAILADTHKLTGTGDMVRRMLGAGLPVRWVAAPAMAAVDLTEMPRPT